MADAGARDLLISYNVVGAAKHARLRALAARVNLTLCYDNRTVADGYSQALGGQGQVPVLVECDTGHGWAWTCAPSAAEGHPTGARSARSPKPR